MPLSFDVFRQYRFDCVARCASAISEALQLCCSLLWHVRIVIGSAIPAYWTQRRFW